MKTSTISISMVLVMLVLTVMSTGNISPGISNTASTLTTNNLKVTDLRNISYNPYVISWTWTNPDIRQYSKLSVYINNQFRRNLIAGESFYVEWGLTPDTNYTISTRVIDKNNVISNTWINQTSRTKLNYQPQYTPPPIQPQRKYSISSFNVFGRVISYCKYDPNGTYTSLRDCMNNI